MLGDELHPVYKQLDYLAERIGRLDDQMGEQIDPREFGRLEADVASLKLKVGEIDKKLDTLVALASEGKGGIRALWFAGTVVAGVLGWFGAERIFK